jgi:hypothetical protein
MRSLVLRAMVLACILPSSMASSAAPTPAVPASAPAELTAEQWRQDLRFMVTEMKQRHANLYHAVSEEKFLAAVRSLDARIPSLRRNQIIVEMMRIAAMVGDGHTRVDPRKDAKFGFPSLPLKLYLFEDGLYIRAAAPEHAALVGTKIVAIGGVPVSEAIRRVSELASRDNDIGPKLFVPLYLNMPDILEALGLSAAHNEAKLTLKEGSKTRTLTLRAGSVDPIWPPDTDISLVTPPGWVDARKTPAPPLWLQAPLEYHRLIELADRQALYVQINMITDIDGQTLTQLGEKIGQKVAATNPHAIVLDLRLSQGGNGGLRYNFIRSLIKAEDADTRLFVLTGRGTFSASQFLLDDLDQLSDAVFIGEPASSKPSSYADAYRMPLPNSGISVRSSIAWWQVGQNRDPWTWVDVAAPLTFGDYAAGRDPALEAALSYTPEGKLADRLLTSVTAGGIAEVKAAVEEYRADPRHAYANQQLELTMAAVRLSREKRFGEALYVAGVATGEYGPNATAFGVLAQIAEKAGNRELARVAGQQTLNVDPNDRLIRSLMERLAS